MGGVGHHVGVVGHNVQADRVGYVGGVGQAAVGLVHLVGRGAHDGGVVAGGWLWGGMRVCMRSCLSQPGSLGGQWCWLLWSIWLVSILTDISLHSSCHPLAFLLSV